MKMRFTPLKSFICSLFLGFHQALACEIELVIAMDVSRSVDQYEFDLMRSGTANAFRHPEIIDMINWMDGGIAVSLTQWSGLDKQRVMLPWRHLQDKSSIARFATEIDQMKRAFRFEFTAPAQGLSHAFSMFAQNPTQCERKVIDLSGDGRANQGESTGQMASLIAGLGVTINGLVIRGDHPDPLEFYVNDIQRGPLSFVEIADGYDDFPRAIFQKIQREIAPLYSENTPQPRNARLSRFPKAFFNQRRMGFIQSFARPADQYINLIGGNNSPQFPHRLQILPGSAYPASKRLSPSSQQSWPPPPLDDRSGFPIGFLNRGPYACVHS